LICTSPNLHACQSSGLCNTTPGCHINRRTHLVRINLLKHIDYDSRDPLKIHRGDSVPQPIAEKPLSSPCRSSLPRWVPIQTQATVEATSRHPYNPLFPSVSCKMQIHVILSRELPVTALKGTGNGQNRVVSPCVPCCVLIRQKDSSRILNRMIRAFMDVNCFIW
jgi:hypothetical protein